MKWWQVVRLGVVGWLAVAVLVSAPTRPTLAQTGPPAVTIWRVSVAGSADVQRLLTAGWDVLESRGKDYVLVLGDDAAAATLRAAGWRLSVDQSLAPRPPMTYDGGYHTVVEHYQHLDAVVAAHPDLARVVSYGSSWRKTQSASQGFALKVICLTQLQAGDCNLTPTTAKPRFVLLAAIHARELTTAELAWRWIDYLADGYGRDPELTALLDYNELWVIPVVNPDGRAIVEQGGNTPYTQRKNANTSQGSCSSPPTSSSQYGVDLNRNADFQWGAAGSSTSPCNLTFRGSAAASEPEEYALENLFANLFPDQRGPSLTDAAPSTTSGTMLTLHSYSDLTLLPWGWTECNAAPCPASLQAPNDAGLRALAFRLGYFNGYDTGQPSELLYAAAGGTDDWTYGALGIASFTFEVGPGGGTCSGFTPAFSCQTNFWNLNAPAFVYAAKSARQPYTLAQGPTTLAPAAPITHTQYGVPFTLMTTVDDGRFNSNSGSVGRPVVQTIRAAEVYVDMPPWAGGTPIAMTAQDGAFSATSEAVRATISGTQTLGRHTLFIRGQDATNTWGPVTAMWLYVDAVDLGVTLRAQPDPVAAGSPLTYTATVTNTGNITATNVVLSDPLPANVTLSSTSASQGSCDTAVQCALGSLAPGASATVTLVVVPSSGPVINTVSVSAGQTDSFPLNNSATLTTTVSGMVPTPTATAAPTATSTATAMPTSTATAVSSATPSATATTAPSATATTAVPSVTMTTAPSATATTAVPSATATAVPSATATAVPSATATTAPSATATTAPSATATTAVPSVTMTITPSTTVQPTAISAPTPIATATSAPTITALPSTPTTAATSSATPTRTVQPTMLASPTTTPAAQPGRILLPIILK